jgi:hypothetical protein
MTVFGARTKDSVRKRNLLTQNEQKDPKQGLFQKIEHCGRVRILNCVLKVGNRKNT